jgi:hypothetical protein
MRRRLAVDHLRALLGDRVTDLTARRETVRVDRYTRPEDFRDYFKARYGGSVTLLPDGRDQLDGDAGDCLPRSAPVLPA